MIKTVIWLLLPATVSCLIDCSVTGNGTFEIGCKAFVVCKDGVGVQHECKEGMVYNNLTKQCNYETDVPPPCGLVRDCSHRQDGSYPDYELNCTSYFTCNHHVYYGHNYCTPGLVFSDVLKTCNWPNDVVPPCGTKVNP